MRSLRQGAAIREQRLAREQPHAPPVRPQPSVRPRPAPAGRERADEGLHVVHQGGQSREGGLVSNPNFSRGGGRFPSRAAPPLFVCARGGGGAPAYSPASATTSISTRASRGRRAA